MSAIRAEAAVSKTVSTLTLSARISESGSVTHLAENVRPVSWASVYWQTGETWERVAEQRVNEEMERLLARVATAQPPAGHRFLSAESWRYAEKAAIRRAEWDRVHEEVVVGLRAAALSAIDAAGSAFWPVVWEESARVFRVEGEWTVTVSVAGTDHTAVREAFASGLPGRREEILADAQNRIPRICGTFPVTRDTPEKVRRDWRRDRRKGSAPKPATGAFSPGSWVTWQHPETGQALTGIVSDWMAGERPKERNRRSVIPSDGGAPVVMVLKPLGRPTRGPWTIDHGTGDSSRVSPVPACLG
ncbi:hypothetical protein ACFC7A_26865 [Streptomyces niveus]|uniref:hypothetical protein n=1 Tax=Streptomyces niveus TaxID=193462 RepID=UPI0035DBCAFF